MRRHRRLAEATHHQARRRKSGNLADHLDARRDPNTEEPADVRKNRRLEPMVRHPLPHPLSAIEPDEHCHHDCHARDQRCPCRTVQSPCGKAEIAIDHHPVQEHVQHHPPEKNPERRPRAIQRVGMVFQRQRHQGRNHRAHHNLEIRPGSRLHILRLAEYRQILRYSDHQQEQQNPQHHRHIHPVAAARAASRLVT